MKKIWWKCPCKIEQTQNFLRIRQQNYQISNPPLWLECFCSRRRSFSLYCLFSINSNSLVLAFLDFDSFEFLLKRSCKLRREISNYQKNYVHCCLGRFSILKKIHNRKSPSTQPCTNTNQTFLFIKLLNQHVFFVCKRKRRKMKSKEKERERKTTKGPLENMSRSSWKDQWNVLLFLKEFLRISLNYVDVSSITFQKLLRRFRTPTCFALCRWDLKRMQSITMLSVSYHFLSGNFRLCHQMTQKYVNKSHTCMKQESENIH